MKARTFLWALPVLAGLAFQAGCTLRSDVEITPWQGDDLVAALVGDSTVQVSEDLRVSVAIKDRETNETTSKTIYVQVGSTANAVTGDLEIAFENAGIAVEQDPNPSSEADVFRLSRLSFDDRYEVVSVEIGPLSDHNAGSRELEIRVEYR